VLFCAKKSEEADKKKTSSFSHKMSDKGKSFEKEEQKKRIITKEEKFCARFV